MNKNKKTFWEKLPNPFFVLAPMADVTDVSLRSMFEKYGPPDVYWTEFVSADGLCSKGSDILKKDLLFEEGQRPIVAQLFTNKPENMYMAGLLVKELGFDGLDINMGCPDKKIEKQGCGADMIRNPENAIKIINIAKKTGLPVSVKTRIGYKEENINEWIGMLLKQNLSAITVHLRTRKEMSKVPAHWELMSNIVALRNRISPETLIIGNGDIKTLQEGEKMINESLCDGVMIGRGIFGNPWVFNKNISVDDIAIPDRLYAMVEHTKLFEKYLPNKSFNIMKKNYKAYVNNFDGAKELRLDLMENALNSEYVSSSVEKFIKNNSF